MIRRIDLMFYLRVHFLALPLLASLLASCGAAPRVRLAPIEGAPVSAAGQPAASTPSPATHRVVAGETLYSIAFRQGRDYRELAAINAIREPFTIYPGQVLQMQAAAAAPAPEPAIASTGPAPAATVPAAVGSFALTKQERPLTAEALPETPNTVQEVRLSASGQVLREPAPPIAVVAAPPSAPASAPIPTIVAAAASSERPDSASVLPAIDDRAATRTVDGVAWRWPVPGKLIGRFLAGDPTQQGIDLAGPVGTPVVAAADGEVVYSGNGLLGYGELLIVQHSPDYLSAYGHNQRRLVQEGQQVRAGQVIAEQGQRGSISLLHFELRKRGKPVDPLSYLPAR